VTRTATGTVGWAKSASASPAPRRPPQSQTGGRLLLDELELEPGSQRDLVLTLTLGSGESSPVDPGTAWSATEAAWGGRVPDLRDTAGRRDARHACAILTGLTSSSGGMVAAATTSLPERASEGRNYDYRYIWIRDQCYGGQAAARAGVFPLLDESVRFVTGRLLEDGPDLLPVYTTGAEAVPRERQLELPGYPGGSDVVGNAASRQFQLDIFGEAHLRRGAPALG
jgi:alpha,alpha-trehalase